MKCHPLSIRYETCATCPKINKCDVFRNLPDKTKDAYLEFIIEQVQKHPDKYILEVVMAENKTAPANNIMILDNNQPRFTNINNINKLSDEEKISLSKHKIYHVTKEYEVTYKVEIKSKPLSHVDKPKAKK